MKRPFAGKRTFETRTPMRLCIVASVAVAALFAIELSAQTPTPEIRAAESIVGDGIRGHMEFLASDLLEGRGTGSRGYLIAAHYVAAEFMALGFEPAGPEASYFQHVPLRKSTVVPEGTTLAWTQASGTTTLTYGEHYLGSAGFWEEESAITAPAVFVGYGITAPEFGYDDYDGIDASGKIVVALAGAPPSLGPNPAAHYSGGIAKAEIAVTHGAVGFLSIWTPSYAQRLPWPVLQRLVRTGSMRWVDREGAPAHAPSELRGGATLNMAGAEMLFDGAPQPLRTVLEAARDGTPGSFGLPGQVTLRVTSRHEDVSSPNVLAVLNGSDPSLRNEYVVFTAHLDHEGIGEPMDGDSIYNGAYDNASGIAALLEVAKAFARLADPPRRSVIFVATAAEEKGLLGADYFVEYPTVPRERIVANLNIDGNLMLFPTDDLLALGDRHSTLGEAAKWGAARVGRTVSTDPMPEQTLFIRSDQYPFVRRGIPALFFINGFESTDPSVNGLVTVQRWLGTAYHTPKDDMSQPMHFDSGAVFSRAVFLIGYAVANDPERPRWHPGDFFGETFGRQAEARP